MSAKVEIPRGLLVGLVGIAAVAVLGLVFLLGREFGRGVGPKVEALSPEPASPPPASSAVRPESVVGGAPIPAPAVSNPAGAVPIPQDGSERAAVAAYFQTVEQLQPGSMGDPEAMARNVLGGLAKGDSSGFDDLIKQAQLARHRLAAVAPPLPCAGYHLNSIACLDAGLDLMRGLKKAMASSDLDPSTLNLMDRAQAIKARTEALQEQEKALKQRYGLLKS